MLKAHAFGFYKVALALQNLRVHAELANGKVDEFRRPLFEELLAMMKEECENLDLTHILNMTLGIESKYGSKVDPGKFSFRSHKYTYSDLLNDLDALDISLSSELREELIFRLPSEKKKYFAKEDLFGPEVASAFPSSIDNIRNAGNCFAVEQWDACVFHLMRVLEHGIQVLAN